LLNIDVQIVLLLHPPTARYVAAIFSKLADLHHQQKS
jgi:hypothetical protein